MFFDFGQMRGLTVPDYSVSKGPIIKKQFDVVRADITCGPRFWSESVFLNSWATKLF